MKSILSTVTSVSELYESFPGGGETGWFAFVRGEQKFYEWKDTWSEVVFTDTLVITSWRQDIETGEYNVTNNATDTPTGFTGSIKMIVFTDYSGKQVKVVQCGDKAYFLENGEITTASPQTSPPAPSPKERGEECRNSHTAGMTDFRYLQDPVETIDDLSLNFPEGGELGFFAFVKDKKTFAYWDVETESWEYMYAPDPTIVVNDLEAGGVGKALSAEMGKKLNEGKATQSTQTVTDPSTDTEKLADVDLAVNAVSAGSAETATMSVKDRFGKTIDTFYATKEELSLMSRQDTMLIYEKGIFISEDFNTRISVFELSKPPVSKEGVLGLFEYDMISINFPRVLSVEGKRVSVDNNSYASGPESNLYFKYFTQIPNLALGLKENLSNKVTQFSEVPSDENYPSEKLVKEAIDTISLTPGPSGADAPQVNILYGELPVPIGPMWHLDVRELDEYVRFSVDGGMTYGDPLKFKGSDGAAGSNAPQVVFMYATTGDTMLDYLWHPIVSPEDIYFKVSTDGGTTYSYAMKFRGMDGGVGSDGITPTIGGNGNWFLGTTDTGITARGTSGTSAPLNISLFKTGSNGIVYPQRFKWTSNKTISSVQLMTNCTGISVTIGATIYDQVSLIGVVLPSGTELVINDILIQTGYNNANAIIILS